MLNGTERDLRPGTTVADLVAELRRSSTAGVAVAVHGEVVARRAWSEVVLGDDDRVELLGAAQGG